MPSVTISLPWLVLGILAIGLACFTAGHIVGHKKGEEHAGRERPDLS